MMARIVRKRRTSIIDLTWQVVYRLAYPLAWTWWRLRDRPHEGAIVAVHVGPRVLLLRSSYRAAWNFPGGGLRPGEPPDVAARRELVEEVGLAAGPLRPAGSVSGRMDGLLGRVHVFELLLERRPELTLDNREIIGAAFVTAEQARAMRLTGAVARYFARSDPYAPIDPAARWC